MADNSNIEKKWPYFGSFEVVIHNTEDDCWVSFLGKVFDLTQLLQELKAEKCIKPLIAMAGKDISHWFDERSRDIQHYIHPVTGVRVPYCPHGNLPDVSVEVPSTEWRPLGDRQPWWKDKKYQVGLLSRKTRPLRIINMLTTQEVTINVCSEDLFYRILDRYRMYNTHADSYTWRYFDKNIDMTKTLDENGIPDEREKFLDLGLPQNFYIPSVFLYYKDDLKDMQFENEYDDAAYEKEMYQPCK